MAPLLFRTPQHDTSTCHVPFCLWIHLCSSSGTDTAHRQRMVFTQGCLLSYMPSKKALLPRSLLSCLLLVCCSGQLHVHRVIIFWNHADQTDTGAAFLFACDAYPQEHAALLLMRARLLSCICTRKMVPLLSRTPQPVICRSVSAVICVHPWNRYCAYTGSASFHLVCFHAYPTETCCVLCYSACLCSIIEVHL